MRREAVHQALGRQNGRNPSIKHVLFSSLWPRMASFSSLARSGRLFLQSAPSSLVRPGPAVAGNDPRYPYPRPKSNQLNETSSVAGSRVRTEQSSLGVHLHAIKPILSRSKEHRSFVNEATNGRAVGMWLGVRRLLRRSSHLLVDGR